MTDLIERLRANGVATISGHGESSTARRLRRLGFVVWGASCMQVVVCPGAVLPARLESRAKVAKDAKGEANEADSEEALDEDGAPVRLRRYCRACRGLVFVGYRDFDHDGWKAAVFDLAGKNRVTECPHCGAGFERLPFTERELESEAA